MYELEGAAAGGDRGCLGRCYRRGFVLRKDRGLGVMSVVIGCGARIVVVIVKVKVSAAAGREGWRPARERRRGGGWTRWHCLFGMKNYEGILGTPHLGTNVVQSA